MPDEFDLATSDLYSGPRLVKGSSQKKKTNSTGAMFDEIIDARTPASDSDRLVSDLKDLASTIKEKYTRRPPGRPKGSHSGLSDGRWLLLAKKLYEDRTKHQTAWSVLAEIYNRDESTLRDWLNEYEIRLKADSLKQEPQS